MKQNLINKGFTLVELLVVIGILGILAAALIAVIDPVEQLDKASDTTKKSVAIEFVGGIARYYASKGAYPWDAASAGGGGCNSAAKPTDGHALSDSDVADCITLLKGTGDLKASFTNNASLMAQVTFGQPVTTQPALSCFQPKSKAVRSEAQSKYEATGATATCTPGPSNACYWCAQ